MAEKPKPTPLEIPLEDIPSVAIRRLVAEVRAERDGGLPQGGNRSFNRTFNRHNR